MNRELEKVVINMGTRYLKNRFDWYSGKRDTEFYDIILFMPEIITVGILATISNNKVERKVKET